ncbi:hypothetical protein D3C86_1950400 [compost metagenome]
MYICRGDFTAEAAGTCRENQVAEGGTAACRIGPEDERLRVLLLFRQGVAQNGVPAEQREQFAGHKG